MGAFGTYMGLLREILGDEPTNGIYLGSIVSLLQWDMGERELVNRTTEL